MVAEGFPFARHISYDEVYQLFPPAEMDNIRPMTNKFCEVDQQVNMAVRPFVPEVNFNETHSSMYLMQHKEQFAVDRRSMKNIYSDARAKGPVSDARLLFNSSHYVHALNDSIHLFIRVIGVLRGVVSEQEANCIPRIRLQ